MRLTAKGLVFYDIVGVKTHDDETGWELTLSKDDQERLVDVDYKADHLFGEFFNNDITKPGYKLAFIPGNSVLIVDRLWQGQASELCTRLYLSRT